MRDNQKYTLTKPLGRGGMGQVWAAVKHGDQGIRMPCAIKVLWPALAMTKEDRERFYGEARIAAQLDHGRIVKVIDTAVIQGSPSLVMEWVDGVNLREFLEKAAAADTVRLDIDMSLYIVGEVLTALEYAHWRTVATQDAGVVHSDVTPGNILISSSAEVKLTDFGIARLVKASDKTLSRAIGTPRYMAPEQMEGRLRRGTDIYALGVVLHELLEGERYWAACSSEQFQTRVLRGEVPALTRSDIPVWVDELRRRMLALDPADRPNAGDAHSMILQRAPGYALAARELKHLYTRCVGKARSRFTDVLELQCEGDANLLFASLVGSGVGPSAEPPLAVPDPDAPALFRRGPRAASEFDDHVTIDSTNTGDRAPAMLEPEPSLVTRSEPIGDAKWEDEQPVEPTIRLPPVQAPPVPVEWATQVFVPAFARGAMGEPSDERTPTDVDVGVGVGVAVERDSGVVGAARSRSRRSIAAAAGVGVVFAGVLAVTLLVTREPPADAVALAAAPKLAPEPPAEEPDLEPVLAVEPVFAEPVFAEPVPEVEPEPEPQPEAQPKFELVPEVGPAPAPKPAPKPKPALGSTVDVTFSIAGVDEALIEVGPTKLTYKKFARAKLSPGTHRVRWRTDAKLPWHTSGTLEIEPDLPPGSFYTVKLDPTDMSVRNQQKGSAK